jgi:hypothetical protein
MMVELPGIKVGVVRGISYGLFAPPDEFVPAAQELGAGLLRTYVYWAQVEPEPGRYVWDTVDALLAQLDRDEAGEELWVTVCASSPWATRTSTNFLPPSPANDLDAYRAFVGELVRHCGGRVRYWQCDNEPSNTGLLWAGTAEEYVTQAGALYGAVKAVDPAAIVVLGGCGYDVFDSPEGSEQRRFFDHLVDAGRDAFDVFSVHLYGAPERVPEYVGTARAMMRGYGYEKPVVAGEHGGPVLFEFKELDGVIQDVFVAAFTQTGPPAAQSTDELAARAGEDTPERRGLAALYGRMADLPPRLRMLMAGCPPELAAKRHRINCRQLVVRTILALGCGVRRTAYWNLAPEVPGYHGPYQMMDLLFGRLPLLDYEEGKLTRRYPAADTFARLARVLDGATAVRRIDTAERPTLYAFSVERDGRPPSLIVWEQRDWFDGEDQPPVDVAVPWSRPVTGAVDALGEPQTATVRAGAVHLTLGANPMFVQ